MGPDVTRKPDKLLVAVKEVTLSRLESCDPANEELLLATLWLLLANAVLGSVWESSDAVTMVKYVEKCIGANGCNKLPHVVAMVSSCISSSVVYFSCYSYWDHMILVH